MTPTIKAIETRYKGYRFRSRLEARWAVFYDRAGIEWLYEPEGFVTSVGYYLPDFYLPKLKYWIEIKPNDKDCSYDLAALNEICNAKYETGFLFVEPICLPYGGNAPDAYRVGPLGEDNCHNWCECPYCGRLEMQFDGRSARISCRGAVCPPSYTDKDYNQDSEKLVLAYQAALSARFEHGEAP